MRKGKKQDLIWLGVGKDGKKFTSASLEIVIIHSVNEPAALNRKTRRAEHKVLKKIHNIL